MVLLAVLTGGIIVSIWAKQTRWYELLLLGGWGLLAGATPIGAPVVNVLRNLSNTMDLWFK
jgi:hypothetical protein